MYTAYGTVDSCSELPRVSWRYFALQLETVESPMYAKAITRQRGIRSRITTWVPWCGGAPPGAAGASGAPGAAGTRGTAGTGGTGGTSTGSETPGTPGTPGT